jgi:uncharacterized protein
MDKFKASRYNHFVPLPDGREITFNSLTRSLEALPASELAYLRETADGAPRNSSDPLVQKFVKNGYLLRDDVDELGLVREMYASFRFRGDIMTLTVMPTAACNFGCDYCFQGADKPQEWMPENVQDQLAGFVDERLKFMKMLSVTWYGGEPLLAMNVIRTLTPRLQKVAAQNNATYSGFVVTNGYRLNRKLADELYSLGIRIVQVTLDGPCESHDQRRTLLGGQGTYNKIVDNLADAVQQTGIQYNIRVNVDARDAYRIGDLLDDLAARGLAGKKNLRVYPAPVESYTEGCHVVSDFVMTREEYAQVETNFIEKGRKLKLMGSPTPPLFHSQCGAIKQSAWVVTPTGDLHKCWNTVNEPHNKVGSIFEPKKLDEPNVNHDKWLAWTPVQDPVCRTCSTLPLCAGNCAYMFVSKEEMMTKTARPCPSWKYNLPQKLVMLAKDRKLIPVETVVQHAKREVPASLPAAAAPIW